jgi:uncharacterized Ntn-hydrolase superfamily protein
MFGVAVSSSSPAVAARCAYARAAVGAVASQNVTDPLLGTRALDLMALGADAGQAIAVLRASSEHMEFRQVLAIDSKGNSAVYSGSRALGIWAEARGMNAACGGNLLANLDVPRRMVESFETSSGHLGDRLLTAMRSAILAGGEAGPVHSAGMKLVDRVAWPVADLRIDWTERCPIEGLGALWEIYKPQLSDYVTRALDPTATRSYGVPGDE